MFVVIQTLRTPTERFRDLPEFPYPPNYCEISDDDDHAEGGVLRVAWVQEGPDTNTGLPDGEQPMADFWWRFREAITTAPNLNIGWFVQGGCRHQMSDEVRAGYDAPFPDDAYCAGPGLCPVWCRRRRMTPPQPPTRRPGRSCPRARHRCWWPSVTTIPSPGRWARSFSVRCPARGVPTSSHPRRRALLAVGRRRRTGRLHRGVSASLSRQLCAVTAEWAVGG